MSKVEDFLTKNPKYIDGLADIVEHCKHNEEPGHSFIEDTDYKSYFTYKDVSPSPQALYQMENSGVLDRVFDSNSTTAYSVVDMEGAKRAVEEVEKKFDGDGREVVMHDFPDEDELPDDLFDDVVGYEDIKWLLRRGMATDDITNFLLIGPPGSAKTVFLMCIEQYEDAEFVPASDASSAGFIETMFESKPKYMLLDELDDMAEDDQSSLSSYTETGVLKETKYNKTREMKTNTKTLATANDTTEIQDFILDRFVDLHFDPYTEEEFIEVCEHILPNKQDKTEEESKRIAESVWEMEGKGDVRKAIAVARLSRGDPEKVIGVMNEYSSTELSSLKL